MSTSPAYDTLVPTSAADAAGDEDISPELAEARDRLAETIDSITQREWLLITRALDRKRSDIVGDDGDTGLLMLAAAWVRHKREHGGTDWNRLLDMTDDQLLQVLGFPQGDETPAEPAEGTPADGS